MLNIAIDFRENGFYPFPLSRIISGLVRFRNLLFLWKSYHERNYCLMRINILGIWSLYR
jgi:hypothetical protein